MNETRPKCESILVIEDDDSIRSMILYALESEGYTVLGAANGRVGLDILHTNTKPCLILLDLMLPVMNGWEFLDALRKQPESMLATIPVIVTSAAGDRASTAAQKAEGYIKKPINLEHLLDEVRKFCGPGDQLKSSWAS
jgi:two-component system chemotaxis response regulator CheY